MSFKYTDSMQRPGARAQGLGKMVTKTEVSTQNKAEDGKDLDTRDPRDERRAESRSVLQKSFVDDPTDHLHCLD